MIYPVARARKITTISTTPVGADRYRIRYIDSTPGVQRGRTTRANKTNKELPPIRLYLHTMARRDDTRHDYHESTFSSIRFDLHRIASFFDHSLISNTHSFCGRGLFVCWI